MEKTVCQLVFVKKVELRKSSQGGSLPSAGMTELPSCPVCLEKLVSQQNLAPLGKKKLIEGVCQFSVFILFQDESVLTILCNHSFHTHCLTQWEDSTLVPLYPVPMFPFWLFHSHVSRCPVCRYNQTPEPSGENKCFICNSPEVWWHHHYIIVLTLNKNWSIHVLISFFTIRICGYA